MVSLYIQFLAFIDGKSSIYKKLMMCALLSIIFEHPDQSCRPGLLPARRLVAWQARPPSRMNFGRFGLTPSVRAMAWPGPRPGQAKIVGLQANDSYFSYRDLE